MALRKDDTYKSRSVPSFYVNLLVNLHPNCTCSCSLTSLTEGRSARDFTQAAPSKKKHFGGASRWCGFNFRLMILLAMTEFENLSSPGALQSEQSRWFSAHL